MDSSELLQCPYDKNHQIRPSRFPYHLVKCRENNMKAAKDLATCPYNARHRVPKQELQMHISNCLDKCLTENFQAIHLNTATPQPVSQSNWQTPPCQENWEDDEDCSLSTCPFVLDQSGTACLEEQKWDPRGQHQRQNERSPPTCSPLFPEPKSWKGGSCPAVPHRGQGACVNADFQNGLRAKTPEPPPNCATGRMSPPWSPKTNPWKPDVAASPPSHFQPNASENCSFQNGQRSTLIEHTPNCTVGQTSPGPAWGLKSNAWKTELGSPHCLKNTSENNSLQNGQWPTTMEQKSMCAAAQTSAGCGKKPSSWKSDPWSCPSHSPQNISENATIQDGQMQTRMGQKPNGMASHTSPVLGQKCSPWKTGVCSAPPPFVHGTIENGPVYNGIRNTRGQTSNGFVGRGSANWGSKSNSWKTGSFQ
ncbi:uncharacterized protein [Ambystoma mexicanum]|uniref:uncharacterized protein isoform X2 n=1 Tax=Ambystoma mexicanum TaxID=8296 RepID=UPI0037E7E5E5